MKDYEHDRQVGRWALARRIHHKAGQDLRDAQQAFDKADAELTTAGAALAERIRTSNPTKENHVARPR